MMNFNISKYISDVNIGVKQHGYRYGQSLYNHLPPALASEINGTNLDPYYVTDINELHQFFKWLEGKVSDET